jgi:hypothetical protein
MGTNSRREAILNLIQTAMEEQDWIKKVQRQKLSVADLKNFATTQLPLLGLVGSLPVPRENTRSPREVADNFISDLSVDIVFYGFDNVTPDSSISEYMDDLWPVLFNISFPKYVISAKVNPTQMTAIWKPYYAFSLKYIVTYNHNRGGI